MNGKYARGFVSGSLAVVLGGFASLASSEVAAQQSRAPESDRLLEEIVVRARRREERIQDVPISVVAVSNREIDELGVQTMGDLTQAVPNFTFQNRGSILGNFGMRGIVTNISNVGVESGLAVYVDGVLVGRPEAFNAALRDVAQVEVLRGPQGTLFGKNTIAGAVNVITPRPTDQNKGEVRFEVGNYNRFLVGGVLNGAISDNVNGRVSVSVENQDGWIDNLVDGRDFNGEDNYSFRAQLDFNPNDRLNVYWTADGFFDDRDFIAQVNDDPRDLKANPAVNIDEGIVDVDSPSTSDRDIWGTSLQFDYRTNGGYSVIGIGGFRTSDTLSLFDGDTQRQRLSDTRRETEADTFSLELRLESPQDSRVNWVAGVNYSDQSIDESTQTRFFPQNILAGCNAPMDPNTFRGFPPGPPFEATSRIAGFDSSGFPVWDFDLDSDGTFNEASVTLPPFGLFGVPEDVGCHNPDLIAFGRHIPGGQAEDQFIVGDPALGFDTRLTAADVPEVAQVHEFGSLDTQAFAVFGHADFNLNEQWALSAGLRHTWEDKDLVMTQDGMINIVRPSFSTVDTRDDEEFSGTLSLQYRANDQFMIYGKYSRGFKSGGFQFDITQGENGTAFNGLFRSPAFVQGFLMANPGATKQDVIDAAIAASADPNEAPQNIEFGRELVDAYELGIKTDFADGRVRLNAAVFYTDYQDVQQNITRLATGIVVLNVPGAEITGYDIDFTALLTPNFLVSAGVGYADSELTDPLIIDDPQNPGVPLVDSSAFVGQRLAQAPDLTANASAVFTHNAGGGSMLWRLDWSHTGEVLHELVELGSPLEALVNEGEYDIVNARVGYTSQSGNWEVMLWGRNIFDERYKAFRRANPIIRVFGLDSSGSGLSFPGSETAQSIAGMPRTYGATFIMRFGE
ncbi:MAG: TonB-dependent receptor [Woeseiaceae bacterium]|nr:TonB-dependent receptor [Woeseiaceae bacterium]